MFIGRNTFSFEKKNQKTFETDHPVALPNARLHLGLITLLGALSWVIFIGVILCLEKIVTLLSEIVRGTV